MTENVVSFEEKRLERLDGTVFGSTPEECKIAAIGSQIEFTKRELETVQAHIDVVHARMIVVMTNEGNELAADPLAHLGGVLSNYEQMLFDQIAELEYQQEMLLVPPNEEEDTEDCD
ncbi:hypothetical protein [Rhizobium ruizarguesonis]|uniref:hypothetical protein n=1 Tax=Rhizobium ruizarguesonis TaxID=2081791 RepID=UPI001032261D|nr:hypothetical protein [Rhizobium ruizarguesonis]TBD81077.1 hypothetical protein ELH11_14870 [Rhizobium ruizarguesonis]TBE12238.1 hypothetical protein ELH09_14950 [Rhizobium ruizarguesonis]WSH32222.1 hypothetical protein U8P70_16875 [Rhizobium ruizarguesonis]